MSKAQGIAQSANQGQFKNRIINGDMRIDQRNNGAAVSGSTHFPVDRFKAEYSGSGALTSQQSTDAPIGFTNSVRITVTTVDSSISSNEYYQFTQMIEGNNLADFNLGTANCSSMAVSFWVKASQTGTYSVQLANSAGTRCYPSTITVNSSNTWEYKTISVPATTAGTFLNDSGVGIGIRIGFAYGSGFNGATANTWGNFSSFASSFVTPSNNMMATNGATFFLTGVQLEKGSTATSFDYRPYGTELALCQRYYEKSYNIDVAPGNAAGTNNAPGSVGMYFEGCTAVSATIFYKVTKRAQPTITPYNPSNGTSGVIANSSAGNLAVTVSNNGVNSFWWYAAGSNNYGQWTASAEL
jgi:hypothetical protein